MKDYTKYERYAKRIPLFRGLSPQEVSDILHRGEIMFVPQGKTIFYKGQAGSNLFVVFSGTVDIFNDERRIARCRVGDAFGEMSVLDHRTRSASAMAATEVKLFTLDESQINDILHQRVAVRFLLNIIHMLSDHLTNTNVLLAQAQHKIFEYEHAAKDSGDKSDPSGSTPTPLPTDTG
jgi:CRP-like cAMP-binding protein